MIVYVCDGSTKKRNVGVGIIRKECGNVEYFTHFEKVREGWLNLHEIIAIQQTINLIVKYKDKKTTIYNDDKELVKRINERKPLNSERNPLRFKMEKKLIERIDKLKREGYEIIIKINGINEHMESLKKAHELSRRKRNLTINNKKDSEIR